MPDLLISKPAETEHAPYYSRYIDLVPDGDILGTLAGQIGVTLTSCGKSPTRIPCIATPPASGACARWWAT